MTKLRSTNGIFKNLNILAQKSLNILVQKPKVPKDVKEGHFAVIAVDEEDEDERFIVPLSYLTLPAFVILLEGAAEEYRFVREGALTIPCRPSELQRMLEERENGVGMNWGSCEAMVESCN